MDFLQISYYRQILRRTEYIESVLQALCDGDRYFLIGQKNLLTDSRVNWISSDDYEALMRKEDKRAIGMMPRLLGRKECTFKADAVRVHYCSRNPNTVYLDTDMLLAPQEKDPAQKQAYAVWVSSVRDLPRVFQDNGSKACFGVKQIKIPDEGIIYNGTDTEFFRKWYQWMLEFDHRKIKYGWFYDFVHTPAGQHRTLVAGFYKHCYQYPSVGR